MGQIDRVVIWPRSQFIKQGAGPHWIARRQHDRKTLPSQSRYDRPCCPSGPKNPRHPVKMRAGQLRLERLQKARDVRIEAGQRAVAAAHNGVDRANPGGSGGNRIQQRHYRLLVRHGDVAAAPVRITAPLPQIVSQASAPDLASPVLRSDPQLCQPEIVDRRAFRLRNGIADHFGIGQLHDASSPSSRSAPSTGSSGIPSTVN